MGFGDPLSPLQSVNRLNFFLCAFPVEKDCYPPFIGCFDINPCLSYLVKNAYFVRKKWILRQVFLRPCCKSWCWYLKKFFLWVAMGWVVDVFCIKESKTWLLWGFLQNVIKGSLTKSHASEKYAFAWKAALGMGRKMDSNRFNGLTWANSWNMDRCRFPWSC